MKAVANDDRLLMGNPAQKVSHHARLLGVSRSTGADLIEQVEDAARLEDGAGVDLPPVRADDKCMPTPAKADERFEDVWVQLAGVANETEFGLLEKGEGLFGEAVRFKPFVLPAEGLPDEGHDVVPVGGRQVLLPEDLKNGGQEGRLGPIERPIEVEDEEDPRTNPGRTLGRPCHAA